MRVLHVTTVGITARAFLLPLFKRLQREGYDVTFACTDDQHARHVEQQGVRYKPVFISRAITPWDLVSILQLYWLIKRDKYALVHTHTSKGGIVGRMAAWLASVPCVVHTMHGTVYHQYQPAIQRRLFRRIERLAARVTTVFIAVTDKVKEDMVSARIADAEHICRIYNGLDTTAFSPDAVDPRERQRLRAAWACDADTVVIGAVARLVPDKGIEDLLRAFQIVRGQCANTVLVIAGEGGLRQALEQLASTLDIAAHVRWTGWCDNVPVLMSAFDVFCLPTLREGFGYVFLEAQAMGLPVAATRIEPLTETMKDGETALLVPPGSPGELAAALARFAASAELRGEFGGNGLQRVRRLFTQEAQLNAVVALYRTLTRG